MPDEDQTLLPALLKREAQGLPPGVGIQRWTSVEVGGRPYNATVGYEVGEDGWRRVVVIYTGVAAPVYMRGTSDVSLQEALSEASRLIVDWQRSQSLADPDVG